MSPRLYLRALRATGALFGVLALTASLIAAPVAFAVEKSGCGGCGTESGDCGSACCLLVRKMVEQGLVPAGATGDCGHATAVEQHSEVPTGPVWKAPEGCAADCPGLQAPSSSKINPVLAGAAHQAAVPTPQFGRAVLAVRALPDAALPPTPPRGPPTLLSSFVVSIAAHPAG